MTNEELLKKEIYCPKTIDLSIIAYLKLGFKILLLYCSGISVKHHSYILLAYQYDFTSELDINRIIGTNSLCNPSSIEQIQEILISNISSLDPFYYIDDKLIVPVYIGENQISELKTHIITNYGNKDKYKI